MPTSPFAFAKPLPRSKAGEKGGENQVIENYYYFYE